MGSWPLLKRITSIICWCVQTVASLLCLQTEGSPNGLRGYFVLCQLKASDFNNMFAHQTRCIFWSCQTNLSGGCSKCSQNFSPKSLPIDSFDSCWMATVFVRVRTNFIAPRLGLPRIGENVKDIFSFNAFIVFLYQLHPGNKRDRCQI